MQDQYEHEQEWKAVDLDGTLAYHDWNDFSPYKIGAPIPKMVARVKGWLEKGYKVSILTARMSTHWPEEERRWTKELIKAWCREHIGQELEVGCEKHPAMKEIWDDLAVGVVQNTGEVAVYMEKEEVDGDGIGKFVST